MNYYDGRCRHGFWPPSCEECARPVAVQPEASPPSATGAPDPRLLKAEDAIGVPDVLAVHGYELVTIGMVAALRRERDALRDDLGRLAAAVKWWDSFARCTVPDREVERRYREMVESAEDAARALASEAGGGSTKKS